MLSYWTIYFRCNDVIGNTLDNAKSLHGIFFKILKSFDEDLATEYHNKSSKRTITISTIFNENLTDVKVFKRNELLKFNISISDFKLNRALLSFLKRNRSIEFNKKILNIEKTTCENIDLEYLDKNRCNKAKIKFLTPTAFRINPSNYPLPEPRKIFKSLNNSFKDIFGEMLLNDMELDEVNKFVALEGLKINSKFAQYKKVNILGFVGEIILNIKFPRKDIQENLEILMQLMPYVGIGYKTGMGMGKCILQKK